MREQANLNEQKTVQENHVRITVSWARYFAQLSGDLTTP